MSALPIPPSSPPIQIAVYISGHGYGHLTRTLNLLSLITQAYTNAPKYNFHIRTTSGLYSTPLKHSLHASVIQINAYQLDAIQSLSSLQNFDASIAEKEEESYLKTQKIQAVLSDALSLPCQLANSLGIPSILITNFTFDSIFQALLDNLPEKENEDDGLDREGLQVKINEMSNQYALADSVIRLPGYIRFPFSGPEIIDAPLHFRAARMDRKATFNSLGLLPCLEHKKVLLHCFGGHDLDALSQLPSLPPGWTCLSQTIDSPPYFYKISHDVYMPDLIAACDAVLGKLGWGTCSEVIGNGFKPFIYVPRSAFIEEEGLLTWMETEHRRVVRLEVEDYEGTRWMDAVKEAERLGEREVEMKADWEKNDVEVVRIFEETLDRAFE